MKKLLVVAILFALFANGCAASRRTGCPAQEALLKGR